MDHFLGIIMPGHHKRDSSTSQLLLNSTFPLVEKYGKQHCTHHCCRTNEATLWLTTSRTSGHHHIPMTHDDPRSGPPATQHPHHKKKFVNSPRNFAYLHSTITELPRTSRLPTGEPPPNRKH
uniref:(northern house mosquito) hypothetical protein n=1 Tax=Culex pipiens TaxID=7175 RepID=A0A8D8GGA6_CULPI